MSTELFEHEASAHRAPGERGNLAPWVVAHEGVLEVARERGRLERREGTSLLVAYRERVHRHLGYGAFAEYTDRHLGYCHRTTVDKLRTAEVLEQLPELARAQQAGRLHASAVRELARVATAETEGAWIEAASGRRVREIEKLVSGRARGDHPSGTPRPELQKHVLRFEVSAETLAAFRDAMLRLNQLSGEWLDDDSVLLMMARAALRPAPPASPLGDRDAADTTGGATAADRTDAADALGRANYQVVVMVCERCKCAYQPAGADLVAIDAATLATACCDAQMIDLTHGGMGLDAHTHGDAGLDANTHASAGLDANGHGGAGGLDAGAHGRAQVGAHTHAGTERDAKTHAGAGLDAGIHAGATTPRAKQSVAPATRRHVLLRDHKTCQVPGCRNTLALDVHHIQPRAEGGTRQAHNQIGICTVHHRAVHRGELHVSGRAPDGLVFQHADGTPYGGAVSAARAGVCKKVFDALCWLGFKSSEARRALDECTREGDVARDAEALLRKALERLG
jgi:hypothetical protein